MTTEILNMLSINATREREVKKRYRIVKDLKQTTSWVLKEEAGLDRR